MVSTHEALNFKLVPTLHRNVLDGEAQDDGPDHSQCHLHVAVDNLCRTHRSEQLQQRPPAWRTSLLFPGNFHDSIPTFQATLV